MLMQRMSWILKNVLKTVFVFVLKNAVDVVTFAC